MLPSSVKRGVYHPMKDVLVSHVVQPALDVHAWV